MRRSRRSRLTRSRWSDSAQHLSMCLNCSLHMEARLFLGGGPEVSAQYFLRWGLMVARSCVSIFVKPEDRLQVRWNDMGGARLSVSILTERLLGEEVTFFCTYDDFFVLLEAFEKAASAIEFHYDMKREDV